MRVKNLSDKELAQARRSTKTGSNYLHLVLQEMKRRNLIKPNHSGYEYNAEVKRLISEY